MFRISSVIVLCVILTGCMDSGDSRLADKARVEANEGAKAELETAYARGKREAEAELQAQMDNLETIKRKAWEEGRSAAEAQLEAQNASLERRAREMEADLSLRQRFYQAVRGTYEGVLKTEKGDFRIRLTMVPSLAPYDSGRVRTLEEISDDLRGLHFSAQVLQWNPANPLSAVGCRVEGIRPDLAAGEISIASEDCPNLYSLRLASPQIRADGGPEKTSDAIAREILSGTPGDSPALSGIMQPTTNASTYRFKAERVGL